MKKFGEFQEEEFEFFRNGISSGRLNPINLGKMLIVYPLLSLFTAFGAYAASQSISSSFSKFWIPFYFFQEFTSAVLLFISFLFFFKAFSLKFQKFQMLILILSASEAVFNMTLVFLVKTKMDFSSFSFARVLIIYIIGSVLIFAGSLFRAYRLLKKGEFRENGRGLLGKQYREKMHRFSSIAGVSLVAIVIGGMLMPLLGNMGMDIIVIAVTFFISVLMYSVVVTEFIFVWYCKLRFPSFNITAEQQMEINKEDKLLLGQINRFEKEKKEAMKRQKREKKKNSKNLRG